MNNYELLFIISANTPDDQKDAIVTKTTDLIASHGTVDKVDKWGMRKFAYPINFKSEGFYVLITFSAPASLIAVVDRALAVNESVIRQMFVKKI